MSFEIAERVFDDRLAMTLPDPYANEQRWRIIAKPRAQLDVVLFVVHTWPAENGEVTSVKLMEICDWS